MEDICSDSNFGNNNYIKNIVCCLTNTSCDINKEYYPKCAEKCKNTDNNSSSEKCAGYLLGYCGSEQSLDARKSSVDDLIAKWIPFSNNILDPSSCYYFLLNYYNQDNIDNLDSCSYLNSINISESVNQKLKVCNLPTIKPILNDRYIKSKELLNVVSKSVNSKYDITANVDSNKYTRISSLFYNDICCPNSELCQDLLKETCKNKSLEETSFKPSVAKMCGCFLPETEYEVYTNHYGVPIQCSPTCNNTSIIPLTDGDRKPIPCRSDLCIIDDISLNIVNSQINGNFNLGQFCGGCANNNTEDNVNQCSCIFNGNSIRIQDTLVEGNLNILQDCRNTFVNTENNSNIGPNNVQVTLEQYFKNDNGFPRFINTSMIILLLCLLIGLVIIILVIVIIFKKQNKVKDN